MNRFEQTQNEGAARRAIVGQFILVAVLGVLAGTSSAQITDTNVRPPPTSGAYGYNSFVPGSSGFPSRGGAYVDPVFGSTIRRMTDTVGSSLEDNIYAMHRSNADGSYIFAELSGGLSILRTSNASTAYSNQPSGIAGFEIYWDALDPDVYYYLEGSRLMRRKLSTQSSTVMKDFGSTLQTNGGSLNVQSADGRYFTVRYGGTNKLWDSQADVIYSGSVRPDGGTGWVSITPNASHFVTGADQQTSYVINHAARSISSNGVMFWNLCGDHGVLVSATNGRSYMVTHECYTVAGVYRVDLTIDQSGRSPQQQRDDNMMLMDLEFEEDIHLSAVSRGPLRDWVFVDTENLAGQDNFNSTPTNWVPYRSEIVAANVITGEVRRLAHHRSRSISQSYYYQPRVSSSWDGSVVMWTSNMNLRGNSYNDLYIIRNPLGNAPPPPKTPEAISDLEVVQPR